MVPSPRARLEMMPDYKAYLTATSYELGGAMLYHHAKPRRLERFAVRRRATRDVVALLSTDPM